MIVKTVNGGSPDDAAFDIDGDGKLTAKDAFPGVDAGKDKGSDMRAERPVRMNPIQVPRRTLAILR